MPEECAYCKKKLKDSLHILQLPSLRLTFCSEDCMKGGLALIERERSRRIELRRMAGVPLDEFDAYYDDPWDDPKVRRMKEKIRKINKQTDILQRISDFFGL